MCPVRSGFVSLCVPEGRFVSSGQIGARHIIQQQLIVEIKQRSQPLLEVPPSPEPLAGRDAPSAPDASYCASCRSCEPSCVADTSARILISDSHPHPPLNNPAELALHARFRAFPMLRSQYPPKPPPLALDPRRATSENRSIKFLGTQTVEVGLAGSPKAQPSPHANRSRRAETPLAGAEVPRHRANRYG